MGSPISSGRVTRHGSLNFGHRMTGSGKVRKESIARMPYDDDTVSSQARGTRTSWFANYVNPVDRGKVLVTKSTALETHGQGSDGLRDTVFTTAPGALDTLCCNHASCPMKQKRICQPSGACLTCGVWMHITPEGYRSSGVIGVSDSRFPPQPDGDVQWSHLPPHFHAAHFPFLHCQDPRISVD